MYAASFFKRVVNILVLIRVNDPSTRISMDHKGRQAVTCCSDSFSRVACPFWRKSFLARTNFGRRKMLHVIYLDRIRAS